MGSGTVLVSLAVSIALSATSMSDINLLAHQAVVFGDPPSDSTVRPTLEALDAAALRRIATIHRKVRRRVWDLIAGRPGGFPWLCVTGKVLSGWIVIDLDDTLIGANSPKQGGSHVIQQTNRADQTDPGRRRTYNRRAGIEATLSEAIRTYGLRHTRHRGQARIHGHHARIADWHARHNVPARQRPKTRFTRLCSQMETAS